MSYWVYLKDDNGVVAVDDHEEGGVYAVGGIGTAEINITYNYGKNYDPFDFSIRKLHKKIASVTIEKLQEIVTALGIERSSDYWAATDGNAGFALNILLGWAKQHPDAIWDIS